MQIKQDQSVQADSKLSAEVAGKTPLLEATIDGAAAEATWELNGERERPNLTLRLRDQTGSRSSATFPAVMLKNEAELTSRLGSLKEALLKVAEWRKTVAAFFTKIRPWCSALPGNPVVRDYWVVVREERSGEYDVPQLMVSRGDRAMVITPVAAWVVGWDGRVDMIGPGDRFILHYTQATNEWTHVPKYLPYRKLPVTEALFRELAEACLDG